MSEALMIKRAALGDFYSVRMFLRDHGADVNAKTENGYTALMMASGNGHLGVVRFLMKHDNVYLNAKNENGWTALITASMSGKWDVVR